MSRGKSEKPNSRQRYVRRSDRTLDLYPVEISRSGLFPYVENNQNLYPISYYVNVTSLDDEPVSTRHCHVHRVLHTSRRVR